MTGPTSDTIPARFARQAARRGATPLFLVKRDGRYQPISWEEAAGDVARFATFLLDAGVEAGARLALLAENRPEWGIADLAIQSVGAWSVPLYPSLTADDIQAVCRDCRPVLCVASTMSQAEKLLKVSAAVPGLRAIVVMEGAEAAKRPLIDWSAALAQGGQVRPRLGGLLAERQRRLAPDGTATLIYTSGTTGEPKGVMLSHRNFLSNVAACLEVLPITEEDVHLSFLPLCHVFERMAGWYLMLTVGARVAYAETLETVAADMVEVRPTIMLGVPRFFEKLHARIQERLREAPAGARRVAGWALAVGRRAAASELRGSGVPWTLRAQRRLADRLVFTPLRGKLGGRLRFFVSGGAPLPQALGEFFYSVGVTILEGYGLTETSPVIAVNRLPRPRFGSVGQPVPTVEVRVAEDGEILTRGPHVMQGYYNRPRETAETVVEHWLRTGDIGRLDDEGFLWVTDRKKDLIKTAGGKFIAPQKLEKLFVADPSISQACVYGDRQPYCVALIVPNVEALRRHAKAEGLRTTSVSELVREPRIHAFYWDRVQARQAGLASFEQVKKIALLDQELTQAAGELTPTLKIKRRAVGDRYAAVLAALYGADPA